LHLLVLPMVVPKWQSCLPSEVSESDNFAWNQTACDTETSTCCASLFSVSKVGCCPLPNAVCCPNGYACCPAGTVCNLVSGSSYQAVYNCTATDRRNTTNLAVCKPGPPLPMSSSLKNVLWIGDSLSIGMTPHLAQSLADMALVQHAPWDTSDGGAEETAYSLRCLSGYLLSPSGNPLDLDLIIVNFGMHDGPLGNATVPGQNAPPTNYAKELGEILDMLVAYKNKSQKKKLTLVYALTTAFICSSTSNGCVQNLNNQAKILAATRGFIVVDPYSAIINKCGPVPNPGCGFQGAWCPHNNADGYQWLVNTALAEPIKKLLS